MAGSPIVEYEFGNIPPEIARNTQDETSGNQEGSRVMMMFDDDGNVVPLPMGRFYYDTVHAEDDDSVDSDHPALNTENFQKPAAFCVQAESTSESIDEDPFSEDEEDEAEVFQAEAENNESNDQFMRIQVAAAQVKHVSAVEKDMDHEKCRKSSKNLGFAKMTNMVRALSSVKMSNEPEIDRKRNVSVGKVSSPASLEQITAKEKAAAARAAAKQAGGVQTFAPVNRMLSLSKSKQQAHGDEFPQTATQTDESAQNRLKTLLDASDDESTMDLKQRIRPGIARVGRMLSLSRKRSVAESEKHQAGQEFFAESSQMIAVNGDGESTAENPIKSNDRSRSHNISHKNSAGASRLGIGQVGRVMSLSQRKALPGSNFQLDMSSATSGTETSASAFSSIERERRETERTSTSLHGRMNMKQVGRVLSLSRRQPSAATHSGLPEQNSSHPEDITLSLADRERQVTSTNSRKQEVRKTLKSAGRMFSFSRKPVGTEERSSNSNVSTVCQGKVTLDQNIVRNAGFSPSLDGRGNKFFYSEINSETILATGYFKGENHIRVPVLAMAEYSGPVSKNKWFIDAFTLPHNAVRRECIDLYDILMALARCRGNADITMCDLEKFQQWWEVAEKFFKCYFEMETTVLFPWVDVAGSKDWEVQMALTKMRTMKDGLHSQLDEINETWQQMNQKKPGSLFFALYKAVDAFCPRVMNYFADQELLLPTIVRSYYTIEDRLDMDKNMLSSYLGEPLTKKSKDQPHHNLVLLIRWMANPRQLRAWIAKNLSTPGRAAYVKWHFLYEQDHSSVVKSFRHRSRMESSP